MALGVPLTAEPVAASSVDTARHKIAARLLPFLLLLYIANYIDRSNIAYAAIGMSRDLKFTDTVFGLGAGIFFVSYVVLHVPGALLAERWLARRVISIIIVAWGLVTALTALVHTPGQLYLARFALGAAESAFFPGVILYLSYWFSRADRAKATSAFMAAIPLSNVIGSPIAGWLLGHKWLGLEGWRWLFVAEGIPAVLLGAAAFFYLTDRPADAKWLSAEERSGIERRLREDTPQSTQGISIGTALRSRTIMLLAAVCFFAYVPTYGLLFWLPSILKRWSGLSDVNVGLVGALPYIAYFVAMIANGWHSDRGRERRWHCAFPLLVMAAGCFALMWHPRSTWGVVALLSIASAGNAYLPVFFSIPTERLSQSAAAASVGMINAVGSVAGFLGPYLVGYLNTKSGSFTGGLGVMMISAVAAALVVLRISKGAHSFGQEELSARSG
jgi:ACS family tartrate transporter-like MFS transporter